MKYIDQLFMRDGLTAYSAMSEGKKMSVSTMLDEFRRDLALQPKVDTRVFNDWKYTFIETCRGVRVAISDPRGRFVSYETLPGKKAPILSANL